MTKKSLTITSGNKKFNKNDPDGKLQKAVDELTAQLEEVDRKSRQKRTEFLIKCLEICADPDSFDFDSYENPSYFCNVAAIIGYDNQKDEEKQEYLDTVEFFNELYENDAKKYIIDFELPSTRSKSGDYYQHKLDDYLSIDGYFGKHTKQSNQEHRLIAIAFAVAVSETED